MKDETAEPRIHYAQPEVKTPKGKCGEEHKAQGAVCGLDKGHEGKHEALWATSGPVPSKFSWPQL